MEPAKKHEANTKPVTRPNLHVVQGGGESTPGRGNLEAARDLDTSENNSGKSQFGVIEGGGESTPGRGNLEAVGSAEKNGYWAGKTDATQNKQSARKKITVVLTGRKAATGGIIGAILAFIGAISFVAAPGLAIVQMKEILTDDLNDQLAAMDVRSTYVMRAKLNDLGKGVCTGVKIRCGFKGMSNRQLKKFEKAGFTVETDGKTTFGRNHVTSLSIEDSNGNRITADNPRTLNRLLGDKVVRKAVKKAFNPKFAGYFDAVWDKFKEKFNLTSRDKIGAGSTEEKEKAVTSATQGNPLEPPELPGDVPSTDDEGNPLTGEAKKDADRANAEIDRVANAVDSGGVSTTSVLGSASKGAIKGLGVLGAADVACTVKNTMRAVEAAAKIYRYKQAMAFASVYLTAADELKAGKLTPDKAEYVGNKLTAIDTDEMIVNENSTLTSNDGSSVKEVKNPYYGANAFDSAGYKVALYNDAPTLSARDMQMAIGGGVALGMLAGVNDFIEPVGDKCNLIQNWAVRGGSLAIGVVLGAITLGWSTAISVGASVGISMALPILENYLAQMTAGTVAGGETKGVDAGNAIFSGTAALMGGMAMARGMKPATKSDLKTYLALNEDVKNEYVAIETEEAKAVPFDVTNRYSFMGSIARTLLPAQTTSSVSIGGSLLNTLSTFSSALNLTPNVLAKEGYNEERFSKCKDSGYKDIKIDADVFCNVRYTMSPYELSLNSEDVRVQMMEWGQVNDDEEGSVVDDSDYKKWLIECTEREQGWGEVEDQESKDGNGARCMDTDMRSSYYRVYTMDASIIAAMDYELPTEGAAAADTETGASLDLRVATFNAGGDPKANQVMIDKMTQTLMKNQPDIAGFQEFNTDWRNAALDVDKVGVSYALYPKNGSIAEKGTDPMVNSILYNSDEFEVVEDGSGIMPNLKYFDGNKLNAPYVLLKERTTGVEVYALNTHDPAKPENADLRLANANQHAAFIKTLKPGVPIIFAGDFNSGYSLRSSNNITAGNKSENLTYCILTKSAGLNDAYDLANKRAKKCPNPGNENSVDHIFVSEGISVSKYFLDYGGDVHDSHYADISIPGTGVSGEATWPLDKKWWETERADFLDSHNGAGTFTSPNTDGIAVDISKPTDGSTVYAMVGGKVVKRPLGRSSYGCTGTPNPSNNGGLMIESDIQGGKLLIAYAHGEEVIGKDTVQTGEKIMALGNVGNSCGGHLHLDMSFNDKNICPQDVFLALDKGESINWQQLADKAGVPCGRS